MSAATASSTERVQVHVRIVDEAVDVWRPVAAEPISEHVVRISPQAVPADEDWSFSPGDEVVIERRRSPDGHDVLVAVARALDIDFPSSAWLRKAS
jgi:hypothetical protein